MKLRQSQRGVAIILVLGAITILSALAVDFGLNSQIQMRLAQGARDRLQAEYLAYSGVNFLRLLMVKEKALKDQIVQLSQGAIDPKVPLCKQFPLSTEMLRAIFATGGLPGSTGGAAGEASEEPSEESRLVTAFDTAAAKEFLDFRGDFAGECDDESGKINLNRFAALNSMEPTLGGLNKYDQFKGMITQTLMQPTVKEQLFPGDSGRDAIASIVTNLGDWIDADETINDRPGVQGGAERSTYNDRGSDFKIRNGKMATLDEAYLIEGVSDRWFAPLRPYFTIYGKEKINICTAEPFVVEALIINYAASNQRIPAVDPANRELIQKVLDAIAEQCADNKPNVDTITQQVEAVLMGQATAAYGAAGGEAAPAAGGGALKDLIDIEGGPYRLIGTGRIQASEDREIAVKAEMVLDTSNKDPKQWKVLYWTMQ